MPYRKLPIVLPKKLKEKGITLGEIRKKTNSIITSDKYQLKFIKAEGLKSAEPFVQLTDKLKKLNERIKNERNLFKKKMFNSELTRTKIDVNILNFQSIVYFNIAIINLEKVKIPNKTLVGVEQNCEKIRYNINHCMESGVIPDKRIYDLSKNLISDITKIKIKDIDTLDKYLKKKVWETELLKKVN